MTNKDVLRCTCSHLKKKHEGGKRFIGTDYVTDCMVDECKCTKYHADYDTQKVLLSVDISLLKSFGIIALIAVLALVGVASFLDNQFDQYTVISKETGKSTYLSNSTIPLGNDPYSYSSNVSFGDTLKDSIYSIFLIIILLGLLAGVFGIFAKHTKQMRELRDNEI